MRFLIENKVIYEPLNSRLRHVDAPLTDAVVLTAIANKILYHLIIHHGELITRDMLFDEVWEKEGIAASSNTLNQYISIIRKVFVRYLDNAEVIITVPRAGYVFNRDIKVLHVTKVMEKKIIYAVSFCLFIIPLMLSLFYFGGVSELPQRKIGEYQGCPIYTISNMKNELSDALQLQIANNILKFNKLICVDTVSFYIHADETLHLNKPARVLFSSCFEWHDYRDTCQNIYYYSWKRS